MINRDDDAYNLNEKCTLYIRTGAAALCVIWNFSPAVCEN